VAGACGDADGGADPPISRQRGMGFFDTSGRDGTVLVRMKEQYDGAEPAGNLCGGDEPHPALRMTDRPEWDAIAAETVANFGGTLRAQRELSL